MSIGILLNVSFICQNREAMQERSACSRTMRMKNNKVKKQKELKPSTRKKRRQGCCSYCENCTTFGLCLARFRCTVFSRRITVPAKNLGTDSKGTIHSVNSTLRHLSIREKKGPLQGKTQVKNLISEVPTL